MESKTHFYNKHFVFVDPMSILPTLWVGTSLGSVLTVSITLPEADGRKTQPVLVSILGKFRMSLN